jgi:hypothetical protein
VAATDGTCGAGAVGAWARVENAACCLSSSCVPVSRTPIAERAAISATVAAWIPQFGLAVLDLAVCIDVEASSVGYA